MKKQNKKNLKMKKKRILLINPPIHDITKDENSNFQPCGILKIASYLKDMGCNVDFVDCLPINNYSIINIGKIRCGNYKNEKIKKDLFFIGH